MNLPLDLQLSAYDYELPTDLIAQCPVYPRDSAKLLIYKKKSDQIIHARVSELADFLPAQTRLIFNESKVFPCRVFAHRSTGAAVEIFFLQEEFNEEGKVHVLLKSTRKKSLGDRLILPNAQQALSISEIVGEGEFVLFAPAAANSFCLKDYLERYGSYPLPPYIKREAGSTLKDSEDYQNYFAKTVGSVAAPTAGLHFTDDLGKRLAAKGILQKYITLHVGLGTFLPVKVEDIRDHKMHAEKFFISDELWQDFENHQAQSIAVGTTSLRALQSRWMGRQEGTDIFLYPGKPVVPLKGLLTNFHLPKSTLLMLVSTLLGREKVLELYRLAVENRYRFFSYGDAMLILINE